jgi:hypothetical protein
MSHRLVPVRTLAEVTVSQAVLPRVQSVTKFQNAPKVLKFGPKRPENDVMSENFLLSRPHLGLSECQRSDNASQVTQGAESIMWVQ